MGPAAWLLVTLLVAMGACIQGAVGFGLGLLTAPLLALVDPAFVPGPVIIAVVPLSIGVALREWRSMDRRGLGWAITGRVPGTAAGSVAIAVVSTRSLAIGLALVVLAAVAISLLARRFAPTPRALVTAGFASGFMGTTTSIGGPPMALVYQHSDGPTMRSTLATYFSIGATLSLVGISLAGKLGRHEIALGVALLPGVLAGFLVSRPLTSVIDRRGVRGIVLVVSAASALALLAEELL